MRGSLSVLILGASGGLGMAMAGKLGAAGFRITGIDTRPPAGEVVGEFLKADVRDPGSLTGLADRPIDIVIIALPAALGAAALENVVERYYPGALIADLFSEKQWFAELVAQRLPGAAYLGIHPLFAPSVEWQGQNLIISPGEVEDARAQELITWFERWGVVIHRVDPGQHDRLMGVVQVGVHAAIVAYARFLVDQKLDFHLLDAVSTPASRVLWAMIARIVDNGPAVYWEIQTRNTAAPAARREFEAAIAKLDRLYDTGAEKPFGGLFEEVEVMFGDRMSAYVELARSLFRHASTSTGPPTGGETGATPSSA